VGRISTKSEKRTHITSSLIFSCLQQKGSAEKEAQSPSKKQAGDEWPDYSDTQSASQHPTQQGAESTAQTQQEDATAQSAATGSEKPPTLEMQLPAEGDQDLAAEMLASGDQIQQETAQGQASAPTKTPAAEITATDMAVGTNASAEDQPSSLMFPSDQSLLQSSTFGDESTASAHLGSGESQQCVGDQMQVAAPEIMQGDQDDSALASTDLENMREMDHESEGALPEEPTKGLPVDELETPAKTSGFPEVA
jgi:hypothetical protein